MALKAIDLRVTYDSNSTGPIAALNDINLEISDREFVTIIGPSGCGKSTLLKCFGGLQPATDGKLTINDKPLGAPNPRQAAFVFQDYTLLPWKNVLDNIVIGLRFAGEKKASSHEKGQEMLQLVGLEKFAKSYPRELSGGMQQRVAVARAMCMDPEILLMDEPFGALDEQTRQRLGSEMVKLLTATERTVVMVTHSLDEAIFWADRIIVLSTRPGRILKEIRVPTARPRDLSLIGTPEFAEIRGELFGHLESSTQGEVAEPLAFDEDSEVREVVL